MSSLDWKSSHKSRVDAESLRDSETFPRHWRVWGSTDRLRRGSEGVLRLRLKARTFLFKTPGRMSVLKGGISSVTSSRCVSSGALPDLQKPPSVVHSVPSKRNFGAVWKSDVTDGSDATRDVPAPNKLRVVPNPVGSESRACSVLCEVLRSKQACNKVLVLPRHSERQSCLVLDSDVPKAFCKAALELESHSNDPRFDLDFWNVSDCPAESPLGLWENSLERLRTNCGVLWEPQSGVSSVTSSSSTPGSPSFLTAGPGMMSGEVTLHFTLQQRQCK